MHRKVSLVHWSLKIEMDNFADTTSIVPTGLSPQEQEEKSQLQPSGSDLVVVVMA
jgi:hypothetical protein